MKKILLTIIAAASVALLPACKSNTQTNGAMKMPLSGTIAEKGEEAEAEEKSASMGTQTTAQATALNYKNLQDAVKGETTASAKYEAYSKKAEVEGFHQIALLFKAASVSENIHANNHRAVLEEAGQTIPAITPEFQVNTTAQNLKDAISGEGYEITNMYPEFIRSANDIGNQLSLVSLNYAYKTEKKHKVLYERALSALENNTVASLSVVYYVCSTCGNTYDSTAPKRCGISMTSSEKFIKISNLNS